jgi:tRNA (mo5U34)-methyltransferase
MISRVPAAAHGSRTELLRRAGEISWYHSLELAPGFVTDGHFDLRDEIDRHRLPERMDGMRALDVGTYDGFWAFEMERRGAEVVALDLEDPFEIDWPAFQPRVHPTEPLGQGFRLARSIFDSRVERVECSVYETTPEALGTFDFAFCGSVLIHLRDQFGALDRIRALLKAGGTFVSAEPYSRIAGLIPFPVARYGLHVPKAPVFWEPSAKVWHLMLEACGFVEIRQVSRFRMRSCRGYKVATVIHHAEAGPTPRDKPPPPGTNQRAVSGRPQVVKPKP